jgi:hypothetical protein
MQYISSILLVICLLACTARQNSEPITIQSDSVNVQTDVLNDTVVTVLEDTAFLEKLLDLDSDEDILTRFGNQIRHREEFSSEVDGSWQVTELFPGSKNKVTFEWRDNEKFKGLRSITISGVDSDWKTKSGIKLGMERAELELLNGKPFLFYYLGWNFQGEVFWNGGALENHGENHGINAVIGPRENSQVDMGLYYPQAPEQISSDAKAARNSDLIVREISLSKDERPTQ